VDERIASLARMVHFERIPAVLRLKRQELSRKTEILKNSLPDKKDLKTAYHITA